MIIDANNMILGRLATFAAKKALLGEKVDIINCENAVITGDPDTTFAKFKQRRDRGIPLKGPYFPRMPDRIVRRAVRGMLPYKRPRGTAALKKVMCYIEIPEKLKDKKAETIKGADVSKVPSLKYTTVGKLSKLLGAKW
ncbi:50S ribosomal protein L13 [candidate division KSB1 bacterium]